MSKIVPLSGATIARLEALNIPKSLVPEKRTNPYTGISHVLDPDALRLYDFIVTRKYVCGVDFSRAEWDNARYHFMSRWPSQYHVTRDELASHWEMKYADPRAVLEELLSMGFAGFDNMNWDQLCDHAGNIPREEENWQ